jgi:aconitate hydratase
MITPGSEQVRATLARDGQLETLEQIGGKVLANACGPCIGQWQRDDLSTLPLVTGGTAHTERPKARNSIINSFNRNFPRRNDGNPDTLSFIASPEIVIAYGLAGRLSFNPLTDPLEAPDGTKWMLEPPSAAPDLPAEGFVTDTTGFVPPADDGGNIEIKVDPNSKRLQLLAPFPAWDGNDYLNAPVLVKVKGKCTTDHISPAGPWLRFRGHLNNISDNMFIGAINAYTGEAGTTRNDLTGEENVPIPQVARAYKEAGMPWVVVGDENYGEGSSREHAAMEPRYLGAAAIVVKSFARIHESNLKKQGVLPLTFADPNDYDKIREDDRIDLSEIGDLAPNAPVMMRVRHSDGSSDFAELRHTMNEEQIAWFKAGSALNLLAQKTKK